MPLHPRGSWGHRQQVSHRPAAAFGCELLGIVANPHKEDDDHGGCPLPDDQSGKRAHTHQGVRDDLPPEARAEYVAEDRVPGDQDEGRADRPGHLRRDRAQEYQPFAEHDGQQHRAEDEAEERQDLPRVKSRARADAAAGASSSGGRTVNSPASIAAQMAAALARAG